MDFEEAVVAGDLIELQELNGLFCIVVCFAFLY